MQRTTYNLNAKPTITMFKEFFLFELKYRLKQPMIYVFFGIIFLLVFGAVTSDQIQIGGAIGSVYKNAPHIVTRFSVLLSILGLMIVAAFMNTSALRDSSFKFEQIMFSKPLSKSGYFFGRFSAAVIATLIPFTAISAAIIFGSMMPWLDAARVGPNLLGAHLNIFLTITLPNILFCAMLLYAVATITRSSLISFLFALGILIAYIVAGNLMSDLDNETFAILLDPFAARSTSILTKYWTIDDKNTLTLPLTGMLLLNRLLWIGIASIVFIATYFRFSFTEKNKKVKKGKKQLSTAAKPFFFQEMKPLPIVTLNDNLSTHLRQFWQQTKLDFWGVVKSNAFIVLIIIGLINMTASLASSTSMFGTTTHPVTYQMVSIIRGSLYLFTIAILTFYSGALVWKERDNKMNEICDALPYPTWISWAAKFTALVGLLLIIQILAIGTGIVTQAIKGYTNFELGVYIKELIVIDIVAFGLLAILSLFIHAVINNKYIGYFAFLVFIIINLFVWPAFDVESNMLVFGSTPNYRYSDMNGFGPSLLGVIWFNIYWILFGLILTFIGLAFWVRGKGSNFSQRLQIAKNRLGTNYKLATIASIFLWVLTAGFVFYNTQIKNTYDTSEEQETILAEYEKRYKKYEDIAQPRIVDVKYNIDLYPETRDMNAKMDLTIRNKSNEVIDSIHIMHGDDFKMKIDIPNATLAMEDKDHGYYIYALSQAMQPEDEIVMKVKTDYISKGFENEMPTTSVIKNGSFFNNSTIMPQIGYQAGAELSQKSDRKKHDLDPKDRFPALEHDCSKSCMNSYISNNSDWVTVESTITTSADQIAIAPGRLVSEKTEGDRRTFHYKVDHPVLNFYSFISAKYEVKRDKWNDVDLEVYYHKGHEYNVDKMIHSLNKSLDYFTQNFGPYTHQQARIIEFPRYASFAQAFPGTMPYSEGIGFIANLESEEDIDYVTYVVAHEMAHQWWAHQVVGSEMQGATLFSESFAQYSALMVMEKMYGKEKMKQFMRYEMDSYLRGRGRELQKEMPLIRNENQPYIHYRKGSVVLFALKEFLGEETMNLAMRNFLEEYKFQEPPYPTSLDVMRHFRAVTPDSLQYILTDMMEEITLFGNRVESTSYEKIADDQYKVQLKVIAEKYRADTLGKETPIEINDWVDIGVYGEPEEGKKYGKLLYLKREKINQKEQSFEIMVNEKPYEAGIDPNHLLIDRMPSDNVKRCKEG